MELKTCSKLQENTHSRNINVRFQILTRLLSQNGVYTSEVSTVIVEMSCVIGEVIPLHTLTAAERRQIC
jgi:hypothetical protein